MKPRMSVKNTYLWINNRLITKKTLPINASFEKQQAMASRYVHLSKLPLLLTIYSFDFSWVIFTYCPKIDK